MQQSVMNFALAIIIRSLFLIERRFIVIICKRQTRTKAKSYYVLIQIEVLLLLPVIHQSIIGNKVF